MRHTPQPRRAPLRAVALFALITGVLWVVPPPLGAQASKAAHRTVHERRDRTLGEAGSGIPLPEAPGALAAVRAGRHRVRWSDVSKRYWARGAIDYVGSDHNWMRDFPAGKHGRVPFNPKSKERRKYFFRAAVRAFAATETPDPSIHFSDLDKDSNFYPFANVAVKLGWATVGAHHSISPNDPVTMEQVHRALVLALHLRAEANGLDHIHTKDGHSFSTGANFGTTVIGMRIGLRYNHSDESMDVGPTSPMPRSEVAWSLYRAATVSAGTMNEMARYDTIELPKLSPQMQKVVQFGIRYGGYPYVWGGDWAKRTKRSYCCGFQPVGGFDCSGFTWWILKQQVPGWDNTPPRNYRGWSLPQRVSHDMAAVGKKIKRKKLQPGDLMFYAEHGHNVDHVDTYIGDGWALDSSGTPAGVTIMWVGNGSWYADHFVHGRDIIH
jgi:NlpC/P60 family